MNHFIILPHKKLLKKEKLKQIKSKRVNLYDMLCMYVCLYALLTFLTTNIKVLTRYFPIERQ